MAFEFLRDSKVYIVYNSTNYQLHVTPSVSFGQTFNQAEIDKKTLHSQLNLFKGSSITSANPANFSFTIPMANGSSTHQHLPLDLLLDYSGNSLKTFTLYIDPDPIVGDALSGSEKMYKLEDCVITNGTFNIPRAGNLSVEISGEATKLSRITGPFVSTIGAVSGGYVTNMTYSIPRVVDVAVAGNSLANVLSVGLEIQNEIEWTKNDTLQQSLAVTNASNTIYPSSFVLAGRTLAGSITQYINQASAQSYNNLMTWNENVAIHVKAGLSSSDYQLDIQLPASSSSFTNRFNTAAAFTQSYDFRLMTSPANLNTYFTY